MIRFLGSLGFNFLLLIKNLPELLSFRTRKRVIDSIALYGTNAIPLVLITGFFAGALVAWQAAYQFKGLVSLSMLGGQVSRVLVMEMAPVLTSLVIAGRSGSGIAASIASMQSGEVLNALKCQGVDPMKFLVFPKTLSLVLFLPVLVLLSEAAGIIGAISVSDLFLNLSAKDFIESMKRFLLVQDISGGLIKSLVFGTLIGLISCQKGLEAGIGPDAVGNSSISSFVFSALCILISDYALWLILY